MKIKITENRFVGDGEEPYVIAELGSNHNGDMAIAKKLIDAAKKSGADCVKFQSWSKENGVNKAYDGLGMLIQQAALSYKIWNNFEPSTKGLKSILGF